MFLFYIVFFSINYQNDLVVPRETFALAISEALNILWNDMLGLHYCQSQPQSPVILCGRIGLEGFLKICRKYRLNCRKGGEEGLQEKSNPGKVRGCHSSCTRNILLLRPEENSREDRRRVAC